MKGLIFTYALTYGGAIASFGSPFLGLLIYVAFALVRPQVMWEWVLGPGGNYSRIVAASLLAGWALHGFGQWALGKAAGVVVILVAFWGWILVTGLQAPDPEQVRPYLEAMTKSFLPCLVAISLLNSFARLRQFAWVIVLSQGYLAYEFNLQYYAGQISEAEWHYGGLDNNGIAILMVTSLGLAFFLALQADRWWKKGAGFASAALMAHVVLFSMSRGGMVAMAVVGLVSFLIMPKSPRDYLIFALGIMVVVRLAGPSVIQEFSSVAASGEQRDVSAASRIDLTKACFQAMLEHPLFGLGPTRWPNHAHEYGFARGKAGHTTWFQVGAENGVVGFVLLPGFYLLTIARLWRYTREDTPVADPYSRYLARAVIASLVGFLVSAQFVSIEGAELPYFVAIVGAGVLKLEHLSRADPAPSRPARAPGLPGRAAPSILVVR